MMATGKTITKAEKVKLTAGRITDFQCPKDKTRTYLWCAEVKGLGVIATSGGAKSYIFQAKVNGKSMRLTIGSVNAWSISAAQVEARRLQTLIDQGDDPRQVKAEKLAAKEAETLRTKLKQVREAVTLGTVWSEYLEARKPFWSERHYTDHVNAIHAGGDTRKRSKKLTVAAPLASLANTRLVEITPELITDWAKVEGATRATQARLCLRLLRAFLFWCARHPTYKSVVTSNAAQSKDARENLGKQSVKNDVLQREQLLAWFAAVRKIRNNVISAYLQTLLLIGSRPNELPALRWEDVDFKWNSLTIRDKVEGLRVIPLTPYVSSLLSALPRRNEFVFSSPTAKSGHLEDPHPANSRICAEIGFDVTLHGFRRSFASLTEWIEMPSGIAAQIQGHTAQGVREKNYIRRPLDLLRMWHVKIEAWILEQAGVEFKAESANPVIHAVK